jgi:hypothetical protein
MKKILKILIMIIPFVIILTIGASDYFKESEKEPYYKIGLSGIKKQYSVGEELRFSLFLNGYGSDCGSYEIQIKKEDKQIDGRTIDINCTKEISDDLEFINLDVTALELSLVESGSYIATGKFSNSKGEKFQTEKTFTVS